VTRTTERWIWIGAVLALLAIGAVLLAGPAGRMIGACQDMMQGALTQENRAPMDRLQSGS
jgi:hypothetical protein